MPHRSFHACTSRELPVVERTQGASRRDFLWSFGGGLGGIALAHLLGTSELLADNASTTDRAAFNGGLHHMAISVEPGRWEQLKQNLDKAGVEYLEESGTSIYFRDPDGARIELIADPLGEMYGLKVL